VSDDSMGAQPLSNRVRTYTWGSHTVLPALLGELVPSVEPWAEIWMGAHPDDPSGLSDGRTLADVVPGLPYLVKLLAAEQPLSIQAHPGLAHARTGFADEEARGVPHGAAERRYKDPNHKPELMVALTHVEALCGFRAPSESLEFVGLLGIPGLTELAAPLTGPDPDVAWREVFAALVDPAWSGLGNLVEAVAQQAHARLGTSGPAADLAFGWVVRLAVAHPGDPGVLAPLFLQLVQLEPGEAVFLAAGVLHAYLCGAGVEVQASSDNVLRGALTNKYVDVVELMRVIDFGGGHDPAVRPRSVTPGVDSYDVPVGDFIVRRVRPTVDGLLVEAPGDRIVVCVDGAVEVAGVSLLPGRSAFVPAEISELLVSGAGTCFVAAPGAAYVGASGPASGAAH